MPMRCPMLDLWQSNSVALAFSLTFLFDCICIFLSPDDTYHGIASTSTKLLIIFPLLIIQLWIFRQLFVTFRSEPFSSAIEPLPHHHTIHHFLLSNTNP